MEGNYIHFLMQTTFQRLKRSLDDILDKVHNETNPTKRKKYNGVELQETKKKKHSKQDNETTVSPYNE